MRLIALLVAATPGIVAAGGAAAKPSSPPAPRPRTRTRRRRGSRSAGLARQDSRRAGARDPPAGFLLKNVQDKADVPRRDSKSAGKSKSCWRRWISRPDRRRPGGVYAYEQQRVMFPAVDNPLAQPYAAFNQDRADDPGREPVGAQLDARQVRGEGPAMTPIGARTAADGAREEVDAPIAEYCAGKQNDGAGIQICDPRRRDQPGSVSRLHVSRPTFANSCIPDCPFRFS